MDYDDRESLGSTGATDGASDAMLIVQTYREYYENDRKYQGLKENGYLTPSDEQQLESIQLGHMLYKVLDSRQENALFRAPLGPDAQNAFDIGCGDGSWAIDVADMFRSRQYTSAVTAVVVVVILFSDYQWY